MLPSSHVSGSVDQRHIPLRAKVIIVFNAIIFVSIGNSHMMNLRSSNRRQTLRTDLTRLDSRSIDVKVDRLSTLVSIGQQTMLMLYCSSKLCVRGMCGTSARIVHDRERKISSVAR